MVAADVLAEITRCTLAAREPGQPAPMFRAIDAAVQKLVGHKLFTLLVVDGQEVARIYSSNPKDYPVSGRKPMNRTPWGDIVLRDRKTWIARSAEDIQGAFFDHQLIHSLGCDSCVNVPIVYNDTVIGTMNVLHEAAWYDESKAMVIGAFAPLLFAPFVAAARP